MFYPASLQASTDRPRTLVASSDGPDAGAMSFEDLPENWREMPLDDDRLVRDVLDCSCP